MSTTSSEKPIPRATAERLCAEIHGVNRLKWWTPNGLWCWVCSKQAKGAPARMCFSNRVDNRGCSQVNRRYAEELRQAQ